MLWVVWLFNNKKKSCQRARTVTLNLKIYFNFFSSPLFLKQNLLKKSEKKKKEKKRAMTQRRKKRKQKPIKVENQKGQKKNRKLND